MAPRIFFVTQEEDTSTLEHSVKRNLDCGLPAPVPLPAGHAPSMDRRWAVFVCIGRANPAAQLTHHLCDARFVVWRLCRSGEIGRRTGLKIPRSVSSVPVRFRPPAPTDGAAARGSPALTINHWSTRATVHPFYSNIDSGSPGSVSTRSSTTATTQSESFVTVTEP